MNGSTPPPAPLTDREVAILISFATQILYHPPLLQQFVNQPSATLSNIGLTVDEITHITDYLDQLKTVVNDSQTTDWWK